MKKIDFKKKTALFVLCVGIICFFICFPRGFSVEFIFDGGYGGTTVLTGAENDRICSGPYYKYDTSIFAFVKGNKLINRGLVLYNNNLDKLKEIRISYQNLVLEKISVDEKKINENTFYFELTEYNGFLAKIRWAYVRFFILVGIFLSTLYKKYCYDSLADWILKHEEKIRECLIMTGLIALPIILTNLICFFVMPPMFLVKFFLVASLLSLCLLTVFKNEKNVTLIALNAIVLCAIWLVSLYGIETFLTVDEERGILEQLDLGNDILRHFFKYSESRSNYLIMGTVWKLLPNVKRFSDTSAIQMAKVMHWYCGALFIMCISSLFVKILKAYEVRRWNKLFFIFAYTICFTNPLVLLALSNYNYDLFALLFSVWSVLLCIYGYKKKRIRMIYAAVCLGALASQEKFTTAVPAMLVVIVIGGYLLIENYKTFSKQTYMLILKYVVKASALAMFVWWGTIFWVSNVLRNGCFPSVSFTEIGRPAGDFFSFATGIKIWKNGRMAGLFSFVTMIIATFVAVVVMRKLHDFLESEKPICVKLRNNYTRAVGILILFTLVLGVLGTYLIPYAYMDGVYEAIENVYVGKRVTGITLHFNESSYILHQLKFIVAMFIMFYNSVPTVYVVIAFGLGVWLCTGDKKNRCGMIELLYLIFGFLLFAAYGFINLTLLNRYINFATVLAELLLFIMFFKSSFFAFTYSRFSLAILVLLASAECLTFGPSHVTYWPVWNVLPYYDTNEKGTFLINWQGGWGDHVAIAGEKIEDYCKKNHIDPDDITIYTNYVGDWLTNDKGLTVKRMPGYRKKRTDKYPTINLKNVQLDDNSFFVFSKWGFRWGSVPYELPDGFLSPVIEVKYRGATECWIYKGSDLKKMLSEFEMSSKKNESGSDKE